MKRTWLLLGLAIVGLGFVSYAKDKTPDTPKPEMPSEKKVDPFVQPVKTGDPLMVQVQVEFIEMSHESLTKLLFLSTPKTMDATPLRKQVQDMVGKNEARVMETQIVLSKSGAKATTESIHEYIYPSEYEPPSFAPADDAAQGPKHTKDFLGPIATAFETKNLGSTLEIEPTLAANEKTIDLRLAPEFIWHTGDNLFWEGKDSVGNTGKVQMPVFYCIRFNAGISCVPGQYTLAAVLSPKNTKGELDETRKVMVFVKCDVLAAR